VHKALLKAKLEPYLGFLHSLQFSKPSLCLDVMELYRYLIDDFLLSRRFRKKDFVVVTDFVMHLKMGKRIHLCSYETNDLAEGLNSLFNTEVQIPRIKHGYKQTLDTLISEEALLLAKFLRNERREWTPRLPNF
jgi:CRISPR/Cas system-associated endonuclease Cas1